MLYDDDALQTVQVAPPIVVG